MQSLLTKDHKKMINQVSAKLTKLDSPYTKSAKQLVKQLFTQMSVSEIKLHNESYWAAVVINLIDSMSSRRLKNPIIEVFNPDEEKHGFASTESTVIQLVNDNIPFIVDSVSMACARYDLNIKLISHPIIHIEETDGQRYITKKSLNTKLNLKSIIYIEVTQVSSKKIKSFKQALVKVISQIRLVVSDWKEMTDQMKMAVKALGNKGDDGLRGSQQEFLQWLLNNHFTFLAYRKYKINKSCLIADESTGLGLFNKLQQSDDYDVKGLPVEDYRVEKQSDLIIITKTNVLSTIHRRDNIDYIGVLETDDSGNVVAEHRFIGLFTSTALNTSPWEIPYINKKVKVMARQFGFDAGSHSGKMLNHIVDSLPMDEVFQTNTNQLFKAVYETLIIQEKKTTHVISRTDKFNRFHAFMVYVPRDLFSTKIRQNIQMMLAQSVQGEELEYTVSIDESHFARLYVVVKNIENAKAIRSLQEINEQVVEIVRTWDDKLEVALQDRLGTQKASEMIARFSGAFPLAYTEEVSPWVASFDVENACELSGDDDIRMSLYQPRVLKQGKFRFKVFRNNKTIPLCEVLPILENLGLHVVSERPYELHLKNGRNVWIQDLDLVLANGHDLELELVKERFHKAFKKTIQGDTESDALNKLVILGGLNWRQVFFLRSIVKYLLQTNLPYSKEYIEKALISHPHITRFIIELFEVRFVPELDLKGSIGLREYMEDFKHRFLTQVAHLGVELTQLQRDYLDKYCRSRKFSRDSFSFKTSKIIGALLHSVKSQDEDNIIRKVVESIKAILRTNFFQKDENGIYNEAISIKINSSAISFLPKPVPFREIFVYSPRVEAIHLRMGKVARGGLRWSDRYEDFRTEVLGLMKAQNVKNSIIVPVGSKGGFVVKKLPKGNRDEVMQEVISCYKIFIGSMLDITDNIQAEKIISPSRVVRYDGDDPYLVVAADKGTATFSDIANGISEERNFWLGDAFASGGSVGYDHKAMGITAKGAWESVKRHFREMGVDCQSEDFSVLGIGDMMGDVFGNGMLLSKNICLKAAFNHMHIFLDPNPDSASSWKERDRLFKLPRSSWEDYNQSLISKGGGIYSRFDKSISLTAEIKSWLKIKEDELTPQDLIKRLLLAEVDLIWNGGIGTYVKSSEESHGDVGDSANNSLRVDGNQLKCKMFGEGGNLGMTQNGRIEFSQAGGRVNADFIDNSAGVDCSDHEVNIKILLKAMMEDGLHDIKSRNKLLASMTDNVSELVLRNNYSQTQTLSFMEYLSASRIGAKAHFIRGLEKKGVLDRDIEFLPNDAELKRRQKNGEGLTRPELCVLLSYSKLDLFAQLLKSEVLSDPWFHTMLIKYFPDNLQNIDKQYMYSHRLKKEIIGTVLTSQVVDRMGATFVERIHEDTGADTASICKAYLIVVELFDLNDIWGNIEKHDLKVKAEDQIETFVSIWNFVRQSTRWILNNIGHQLDIQQQINDLQTGVKQFQQDINDFITETDARQMNKHNASLLRKGFEDLLAHQIASMPYLKSAMDVVMVANRTKILVKQAAAIYFPLGKSLNLLWLQKMIEKLTVENQWHVNARGGLRDDLYMYHAGLTSSLIKKYGTKLSGDKVLTQWLNDYPQEVKAVKSMMTGIRAEKQIDYATVMVAINSLSNLAAAIKQ